MAYGFNFYFELKCDPKIVTKILSSTNRDDRFADDKFAVVAKINKVDKIEIKSGPRYLPIIAKGECLDVEYLGEG